MLYTLNETDANAFVPGLMSAISLDWKKSKKSRPADFSNFGERGKVFRITVS